MLTILLLRLIISRHFQVTFHIRLKIASQRSIDRNLLPIWNVKNALENLIAWRFCFQVLQLFEQVEQKERPRLVLWYQRGHFRVDFFSHPVEFVHITGVAGLAVYLVRIRERSLSQRQRGRSRGRARRRIATLRRIRRLGRCGWARRRRLGCPCRLHRRICGLRRRWTIRDLFLSVSAVVVRLI